MLFDPHIITRSASFELETADGMHMLIPLLSDEYKYLIKRKGKQSHISEIQNVVDDIIDENRLLM